MYIGGLLRFLTLGALVLRGAGKEAGLPPSNNLNSQSNDCNSINNVCNDAVPVLTTEEIPQTSPAFIKDILERKSSSAPYSRLEEYINSLRFQIEGLIQEYKQKAEQQQKKLLIVVGENHHDSTVIMVHSILLQMAKKHGFQDVVYELAPDDEPSYASMSLKEDLGPDVLSSKLPITYRYASSCLGYKAHCADLNIPLTPANMKWLRTFEAQLVREQHMRNYVQEMSRDALFFVGDMHMKAFVEDISSASSLMVLPITINHSPILHPSSSLERERDEFLKEDQRIIHINTPKGIREKGSWQLLSYTVSKHEMDALIKAGRENGQLKEQDHIITRYHSENTRSR